MIHASQLMSHFPEDCNVSNATLLFYLYAAAKVQEEVGLIAHELAFSVPMPQQQLTYQHNISSLISELMLWRKDRETMSGHETGILYT